MLPRRLYCYTLLSYCYCGTDAALHRHPLGPRGCVRIFIYLLIYIYIYIYTYIYIYIYIHIHIYNICIYIYIYIYVCVCVCVCHYYDVIMLFSVIYLDYERVFVYR